MEKLPVSESPSLFEELRRVVLPLIAIERDAAWHPIGTAFVVSTFGADTALVITAAHNVAEVIKLDRDRTNESATTPLDFKTPRPGRMVLRETEAYVGVEGPSGFVLAKLEQLWHPNEHDVAVGLARFPSGVEGCFSSRLAIDTTPIGQNTQLTGIGYSSMQADFSAPPDYDRPRFEVQFRKRIEARAGRVTRVCKQGIGIHKCPGFLVDFAIDSGMSGGPLIERGKGQTVARGVMAGDLSIEAERPMAGSGVQAFAAMLWPTLGTVMHLEVRTPQDEAPVTIERAIDLVRMGAIDDRGASLEHFSIEIVRSGERFSWRDRDPDS